MAEEPERREPTPAPMLPSPMPPGPSLRNFGMEAACVDVGRSLLKDGEEEEGELPLGGFGDPSPLEKGQRSEVRRKDCVEGGGP